MEKVVKVRARQQHTWLMPKKIDKMKMTTMSQPTMLHMSPIVLPTKKKSRKMQSIRTRKTIRKSLLKPHKKQQSSKPSHICVTYTGTMEISAMKMCNQLQTECRI